ncbi:MAG: hypothetical protein CMB02_02985 [Euryarchaeota archaeon]|nr:hypothetical protein [Euryarchaeota archaeon]
MGIAGPKGPTKEKSSELIGDLFLVGARGKCCAVITERQLTIERFDGKGVRLDLAAIERMRHLKAPILPSGVSFLGLVAVYLGLTTIVSPMSWFAIAIGVVMIIANFVSRYSILAIETGAGGRHLISGSETNLLKLCLVVDRLRHGSSMGEALIGLESLETEPQFFPSIKTLHRVDGGYGQATLPMPKELESSMNSMVNRQNDYSLEEKEGIGVFNFGDRLSESEKVEIESGPVTGISETDASTRQNAYQRAWGGREAPSWYQEKEAVSEGVSRIDSALSGATESLDMFSPGGLFDAVIPEEKTHSETTSMFNANVEESSSYPQERTFSSSQMIKRAHAEFGPPDTPFSGRILPPPTEDAVREECRAGVVKQARAQQELKKKRGDYRENHAANLDDYPALNRLASTMSSSIVSGSSKKYGFSTSWLGRLLSPGSSWSRMGKTTHPNNSEIETERFQTTQHMRLRSDQDHQAEVRSRIGTIGRNEASTARDKLDSIVRRISDGDQSFPRLFDNSVESLKFSQLNPTSSEDDPHPLPGLRRLG